MAAQSSGAVVGGPGLGTADEEEEEEPDTDVRTEEQLSAYMARSSSFRCKDALKNLAESGSRCFLPPFCARVANPTR